MDLTSANRGRRPRDPKLAGRLEVLEQRCAESIPGLVRFVQARLRHHGFPLEPNTVTRIIEDTFHAVLPDLPRRQPPPPQPRFRKTVTEASRKALQQLVEKDQRIHLSAAIEGFEKGQADPWRIPVPARTVARLARGTLEAIDQVPSPTDRIVLRGILAGTHSPTALKHLLDLPDLAPTLARAFVSLSQTLEGRSLPGFAGFLSSLRDDPLAPPGQLLSSPHDPSLPPAQDQRIAELSLFTTLTAQECASRLGTRPEQVESKRTQLGLGGGPWTRVGAMVVDMARFTQQLEVRDLADYVARLFHRLEAASSPAASWKLVNRDLKLLAFWCLGLLTQITSSTYGPGLTGPWIRARLRAGRHSVTDLRAWLSEAGVLAAGLDGVRKGTRLSPQLSSLLSPRSDPPGPDLTRPLKTPHRFASSGDATGADATRALLPVLSRAIRQLPD